MDFIIADQILILFLYIIVKNSYSLKPLFFGDVAKERGRIQLSYFIVFLVKDKISAASRKYGNNGSGSERRDERYCCYRFDG